MTTLLICLGAIAALLAMGYLAACAGAGRWLPLSEWLARTSCSHAAGFEFVRNIYGDEINMLGGKRSVWRCSKCGNVQYRDELQDDGDLRGVPGPLPEHGWD